MREITINAIQKCKDEIIELQRRIDVMEQEGKPGVEFEFLSSTNVWLVQPYTAWNWQDSKYRVKQQPMEVWAFKYISGAIGATNFSSKENCRGSHFGDLGDPILFLQALPDKEK